MTIVASLINDISFSFADQSAPMVLGSLVFTGHEIPGRVIIGGSQRLAIHKLPGGIQFIDAMGSDDSALSWRGIFLGPNAGQRARLLNLMRTDGIVRVLSFGDYVFSVIVSHVEYVYKDRGAVIDYRVKVEIVSSVNQGSDLNPVSIQEIVQDCKTAAEWVASASIITSKIKNSSHEVAASSLINDYTTHVVSAYTSAIIAISKSNTDYDVGANANEGILEVAALATQTAIKSSSVNFPSTDYKELKFITKDNLLLSTYQAGRLAAFVQAGGYINKARINQASLLGLPTLVIIYA